MSAVAPAISVIVPTCRRVASLTRLLSALERQDPVGAPFEVVVVADGDEQAGEFLKAYQGPLKLQFAVQPAAGAGPARNRGASLATGRVLLFLDDDIEPSAGLVHAHLKAAGQGEGVCIGNLTTVISAPHGFLEIGTRIWWERKLRSMRQPGHRFDYMDLLSGHFSLPQEVFRRVGGFNPEFACREDYELGARLIKERVRFRFLNQATALHHETPQVRRTLGRSRAEGAGDVRLARKHPELVPTLVVTRYCRSGQRRERWTMGAPRLTERWARVLEATLNPLERCGLRKSWEAAFQRLKRYWYVRGIASECRDWADLEACTTAPAAEAVEPISVDLAQGLKQAEGQIESQAPAAVRVLYAGHPVGVIPALPATEPVRGRHLRPFLRDAGSFDLLVGVAWEYLTTNRVKPKQRCL